jgi:transposase
MERRKFTRKFKLEAVKLIKDRGVAVSQASHDLGVHQAQLRKWVKDFCSDAAEAFPGHGQQKPEQAEIARLKREVTKLKAERDILKKAAVSSTGERNALGELSTRCLISKRFPRTSVEFECDRVKIVLAIGR